MQDGTKREAVSWKLSAAFFWWFLVILNVCVCNMLLKNASQNHQKNVRKIVENGSKMVPNPLQNRSWRGSGGHLGATLETRCSQDFILYDFSSILGPPLGWDRFGVILGIICWRFFEMAFWWPWPQFGLPKHLQMRPRMGSKPEAEIRRFCAIY